MKTTVQHLVDQISTAVTKGQLEDLANVVTIPLPVHQASGVTVYKSHSEVINTMRTKAARAKLQGACCLTSKVSAVGIPRGDTLRAWVEWTVKLDGDTPAETHSTLIYLRRDRNGSRIEMIHCLNHHTGQKHLVPSVKTADPTAA